jgi:hypothetical protein
MTVLLMAEVERVDEVSVFGDDNVLFANRECIDFAVRGAVAVGRSSV